MSDLTKIKFRALLAGAGWSLLASVLSLFLLISNYAASVLSIGPAFKLEDYVLGGGLLMFAGTRLVGISIDFRSSGNTPPFGNFDRIFYVWAPVVGWLLAVLVIVFLSAKFHDQVRTDRISVLVYTMVFISITYSMAAKAIGSFRRVTNKYATPAVR